MHRQPAAARPASARPAVAVIALGLGLTLLLTGCGAATDIGDAPRSATTVTPTAVPVVPAPGSTSTPDPASWATTSVPSGFTAVVVTASAPGTDAEIDAAVATIRERVGTGGDVVQTTLTPATSADPFADILASAPDLVIVLGPEPLDATDRSSSTNLGQQFLVIGAQLPEPTANVTAVVWPGADARRIDEERSVPNGMPELAAHAGDAFQAGLSALLSDTTGGVLLLP